MDWPDLSPDCGACAALCCVALFLERGDSFAIDKPAGTPCPNLTPGGHTCTIHDRLERAGFSGCARYDCLGAGQRTVQDLFGGHSWRARPHLLPDMIEGFRLLRRLHEMLDILRLCSDLTLDETLTDTLDDLLAGLAPPADGWTLAALSRLESDGVFDTCKKRLALFRSALADARDKA